MEFLFLFGGEGQEKQKLFVRTGNNKPHNCIIRGFHKLISYIHKYLLRCMFSMQQCG